MNLRRRSCRGAMHTSLRACVPSRGQNLTTVHAASFVHRKDNARFMQGSDAMNGNWTVDMFETFCLFRSLVNFVLLL